MQLLRYDALLLKYGGTAQYKILGIGLVIAGVFFGLVPLVLNLRNKQPAFIILSVFGLALLVGGIWALSYHQSVILDGTMSSLRISSHSIFGKSEQQIPFSCIREIGIRQRFYSSTGSQAARQMFYMEFRFHEDSTFKLEDDDFNDTEEQVRKRAAELAAFCGTIVNDVVK